MMAEVENTQTPTTTAAAAATEKSLPKPEVPLSGSKRKLDDAAIANQHVLASSLSRPANQLAQRLAQIRRLVHAYTDPTPTDWATQQGVAEALEDLTDYPLQPPIHGPPHCYPAPDIDRQELEETLRDVYAAYQRLDGRSVQEIQRIQDITQVKVVRRSSTCPTYIHLVTGLVLTPAAYEERYTVMLDEVSQLKSQHWSEYFADLRRQTQEEFLRVDPNSPPSNVEATHITPAIASSSQSAIPRASVAKPTALPFSPLQPSSRAKARSMTALTTVLPE